MATQFNHLLLIVLLDLLIAAYIYYRGPKKQAHLSFTLTLMAAVGWTLCLWLVSNTRAEGWITPLSRLSFATGILAPAALLHFVHCFPNQRAPLKKLALIYLPALGLSLISLTPLIVRECRTSPAGLVVTPGPAYAMVIAYLLIYVGLAFTKAIQTYRRSAGLEKIQWLFIIFGLPLPIVHGVITNTIMTRLGFNHAYTLGPWASVEMALVLGYATLRYRLFDAETVVKRAAVYAGLVAAMAGVYGLFTLVLEHGFGASGRALLTGSLLVTAAVVAVSARPLQSYLEGAINLHIFHKRNDHYRSLEELILELNGVLHMEEILDRVAGPLVEKFDIKHVAIYLRADSDEPVYVCRKKNGESPAELPTSLAPGDPLLDYIQETRATLEAGEFRHRYGHLYNGAAILDLAKAQIQDQLDHALEAALVMPLVSGKRLAGFVVFGNKASDRHYTQRDLILLKALCWQMAATLENIRLTEQLFKTEKMAVIGKLATSLSHEIKNPLTAIRTFVEAASRTEYKKEFFEKIVEMLPGEVDRIAKILTSLEEYTPPSSRQKSVVLLADLAADAVMRLKKELDAKFLKVKIVCRSPQMVRADLHQLRQVASHLLLNACQASLENGSITVTIDGKNGQARMAVADEGDGIPKENLGRIFDAFFSTKIYGIGLGLSTSKRIVEEHGGQITVESEEGKGSVFTVTLPAVA